MCVGLQVKTERWSKQKEKKERKQRRREIKDRKRKLKEQKLDDDDIDDLNSDVRLMKKLKKRKVINKMIIETYLYNGTNSRHYISMESLMFAI